MAVLLLCGVDPSQFIRSTDTVERDLLGAAAARAIEFRQHELDLLASLIASRVWGGKGRPTPPRSR